MCCSFAVDNLDKYITQINENDFKSYVDKNIQSSLLSIKKKGLISSIFVDVDKYKEKANDDQAEISISIRLDNITYVSKNKWSIVINGKIYNNEDMKNGNNIIIMDIYKVEKVFNNYIFISIMQDQEYFIDIFNESKKNIYNKNYYMVNANQSKNSFIFTLYPGYHFDTSLAMVFAGRNIK